MLETIGVLSVCVAAIFYTVQARKFSQKAREAMDINARQSKIFSDLMTEVDKELKRNEQKMNTLIEESNLLVMIRDDLAAEVDGFRELREKVTRALYGQNFSRKKKVRGKKKVS